MTSLFLYDIIFPLVKEDVMDFIFAALGMFIILLLVMQIIFFEISRRRAIKMHAYTWFLSLEKPFNYNRTGTMVFICSICYFFNGIGTTFSSEWFLYLFLFIASGIISDAIVQFIVQKYGQWRCANQIEEAAFLEEDLKVLRDDPTTLDEGYEVSLPLYNEISIAKNYLKPTDHMAFLTVDKGEFVKAFGDYPERAYDVEPYADTEEVQANLGELPVKAIKLTDDKRLPFKNDKIDLLVNEYGNYDKYEAQRVLKPGAYFIVNQYGSQHLDEFLTMYRPIIMRGSWMLQDCIETLKKADFEIIDSHEDKGYIRFRNIRQLYSYFKKTIHEVADNIDLYNAIFLEALRSIKEQGYYQLTTYTFIVVARNTKTGVGEYTPVE